MKIVRTAIKASLSALFLLSIGLATLNRQAIYDWYTLLDYSPSANISSLAINSGMSERSSRVFYVYRPELLDRTTFNVSCPINEETIVLGCYNGKNIYLFNVTDDKLNGIKEVTAAHEMLHAEYDRLSERDRTRVDELVMKELNNLNDERIKSNIEAYRKKDSSVVINEAHSILGTEVANLSPELEKYYSKYFIDRSKVVKLSEAYESVFTNIKSQIKTYDNQLNDLKSEIENREASLSKQADDLTAWSTRLDTLKKDNKISDYNSQVYAYNSSVEEYRLNITYVKNLITKYNTLVETRNQLSLQQNSLFQNIDSKSKEL